MRAWIAVCLIVLSFWLMSGEAVVGATETFGKPGNFVAICETERVVRYDKYTRYGDGEVIQDGWDSDSFGPWRFEYDGSDTLLVDSKPVPIMAVSQSSILASTTFRGFAFGAINQWSYAVHLGLGVAVGSNIQSTEQAKGAIKVRAWNMECEIEWLP